MTSTFIAENTFAIAIGAVSLILFAQLIGNMQVINWYCLLFLCFEFSENAESIN